MKTHYLWCSVFLVMLILPGTISAGQVPAAGDLLVDMRLDTPETPDKRAYLGLSEGRTFDPKTIAGQLLVIEIFSMYCPHCQREAPAINHLYRSIQASETLQGRVKMIGIGVGNSTFEVDHFRKHYGIEFPLFPDETFTIHKALGEVRTPFFIITTVGSDDKGRILWTGTGELDPLKTFMGRLNGLLDKR